MADQKIPINLMKAMPAKAAAAALKPQFVLQPQQLHLVVPPHQFYFLNGPIVVSSSAVAFDDRYDGTLRWYFPEFSLKATLSNSFSLTCRQSGVDRNAKPIYSGQARFTVSKSRPSSIATLAQTPGITYREIPLQNLTMAFVVRLFDNSTLPYPAKLVQQGDDYLLTIDLEDEQSLTSFYKFISDPANKNYCALSISGGYFGYLPTMPKPVQFSNYQAAFVASHLQTMQAARSIATTKGVSPAIYHPPMLQPHPAPPVQPYQPKSGIPFGRTIANVNFDCHSYPQSYLLKSGDSDTATAFGCNPPFGDASARRFLYEAFNLTQGSLSAEEYGVSRIYRNTYNGSFMVIPERYVIALDHAADEHLLTPSAHLYTSIDLEDAHKVDNSRATFQFGIVPEISEYQLLLLKRLILDNLPSSPERSIDDIAITFPQKIINPEMVVFDALRIPTVLISALGAYANGVSGSQCYNLQFQNVSIGQGHAEWIAQQVKRNAGFPPPLTATISFDVDAESSEGAPQSSIALSLARVGGNGLSVEPDSHGNATLVNHTLYDVIVTAYQDKAGKTPLATPVQIPANGSSSVIAGEPLAVLRYSYSANPDYLNQILKEIRVVNLDTISDDVIVTNNTGLFELYGIESIDFIISIITPGETDPAKALAVASTTIIKDGVINHVPFSLPVAQYLSRYSAVYSTVVNFRDGRQQANPASLIDDLNSIGKLINLTVSRLNLPRLGTG